MGRDAARRRGLAGGPQPLAGDAQRGARRAGAGLALRAAAAAAGAVRARRSARSARSGFRGLNVTVPHKVAALRAGRPQQPGGRGDRRRQHADASRTAPCTPTTPTPAGFLDALGEDPRRHAGAGARRGRRRARRGLGAARAGRREVTRAGTAPPSAPRRWRRSSGVGHVRQAPGGGPDRELHHRGPRARHGSGGCSGGLGLAGCEPPRRARGSGLRRRADPSDPVGRRRRRALRWRGSRCWCARAPGAWRCGPGASRRSRSCAELRKSG